MATDASSYRSAERAQDQYTADLDTLDIVSGHAVGLVDDGSGSGPSIGLEIFVFEQGSATDPKLQALVQRIKAGGVPVQITRGDFRAVSIPPMRQPARAPSDLEQKRTDKFDPIVGGISCGPDVNILRAAWSGTLGLAVHRIDKRVTGLLSNKHVMYYDDEVKTVCQPARVDSFFNYPAGDDLVARKENMPFEGRETYVDAAVASLIKDRTANRKSIFGIADAVTGVKKRSALRVGDKVVKSGLRTGVTHGRIKYISASDPTAKNQIVIEGELGAVFADHGDSGSVVLSGTEVIGLLWGGINEPGSKYVMVSPIEAVFESLKLSL